MKKSIAAVLICSLICALMGCIYSEPTTTVPSSDTTEPPTSSPSPTAEASKQVTINEVMPDNQQMCMGHMLDWIELYNQEDEAVALDGYYLSDEPNLDRAIELSGMQIPADGYLTISLPEDAPFHLSSQGETVYLMFGTQIISQLTYQAAENGASFDANGECPYPTPGFANTLDGYAEYLATIKLPDVYISEVMSSNSQYTAPNGGTYDFIEVVNQSQQPVCLSDYSLTDKRSEPQRYSFPNVTLQSGECYVVYCSGDSSMGDAYADFKISASGETVYLAKNGIIIDAVVVPADLQKNQSFGRKNGQNVYFYVATPGAPNGDGFRQNLSAPAANLPSGVYSEPISVELSGTGTIYYTMDGSRPTEQSSVYTQPLLLTDASTTIRAFCVNGSQTSEIALYTYLIGVSHSLPIVSISIPQQYLTGDKGVLSNINKDYEYEAVLTLIEDGVEKFSLPFGFCLHGNGSRAGEKQNFSLRFRAQYGANKLQYQLFDDLDIDEFNSLLLKGGSEDYLSAMMRDELGCGIAEETSLYVQARKAVVLYLGGEYWGIYYFRERFSDDYVASHLNVSASSVDLLRYHSMNVQAGSNADLKALRTYVANHDMSTPENYAYLCSKIDVQSLMDWYICRSYMGDQDLDNIRCFRSSEGDGKWKWMYFDLDWSFWVENIAPFSSIIKTYGGERELMLAVLASEEGQDAFLKRYAQLMQSVLNETYITAYIDSLASEIRDEIEADRTRWGKTVAQWESAVERLYAYVRNGKRNKVVIADLQNYFALSDAEMANYFG